MKRGLRCVFYVLIFGFSTNCFTIPDNEEYRLDPALVFSTASTVATEAGRIAGAGGDKKSIERQGMFNIFSNLCALVAVAVREDQESSAGREQITKSVAQMCDCIENSSEFKNDFLEEFRSCKSRDEKEIVICNMLSDTSCQKSFVTKFIDSVSLVMRERIDDMKIMLLNTALQVLAAETDMVLPILDKKILDILCAFIGDDEATIEKVVPETSESKKRVIGLLIKAMVALNKFLLTGRFIRSDNLLMSFGGDVTKIEEEARAVFENGSFDKKQAYVKDLFERANNHIKLAFDMNMSSLYGKLLLEN